MYVPDARVLDWLDAMDYTTISFNFDGNPPSVASIEKLRSFSSMEVSSQPSVNWISYESMSSDSFCFIGRDPQDCEVYMDTPDPSLSPPVFDAISISEAYNNFIAYEPVSPHNVFDAISISEAYNNNNNNHATYEPVSPINGNMSYESSSPLALLPMLPQPEYDSRGCLSTFEIEFLDTGTYDQFIQQHHPLLEIEPLYPYERSERTLNYEQL